MVPSGYQVALRNSSNRAMLPRKAYGHAQYLAPCNRLHKFAERNVYVQQSGCTRLEVSTLTHGAHLAAFPLETLPARP